MAEIMPAKHQQVSIVTDYMCNLVTSVHANTHIVSLLAC